MSLFTLHSSPLLSPPRLFTLPTTTPTTAISILRNHQIVTLVTAPSFSCRRRHRAPAALSISDSELLRVLDCEGTHLPAVRNYEADLARLTVVGEVGLEQAVTAAAADGGDAAEQHLSSAAGAATAMVVETLSRGSAEDHASTVSTRLFLSPEKVREKAWELRSSVTADILSADRSAKTDILAMTFRQVVMHQLWMFELSIFAPGTKRDMEDLASQRKAPSAFAVSSSDLKFIAAVAEVLCSCALQNTGKWCLGSADGLTSKKLFGWFWKTKRITSLDSSICLYITSEEEIVKNAKKQIEKFNVVKEKLLNGKRKLKFNRWGPPRCLGLDGVEGSLFSDWINEHISAYRLQVDAAKFKDLKLEGWQNLADNRWEVPLTHFQMVELANILDLFYEDKFTIPEKQLLSGLLTEISDVSFSKTSFWRVLFIPLAIGCLFIVFSIIGQICRPHFSKYRKLSAQQRPLTLDTYNSQLPSTDATDVDRMCISVVKQIKDSLSWPGEVTIDASIGAWTGMLPSYLKGNSDDLADSEKSVTSSSYEKSPTSGDLFGIVDDQLKTSAMDMQRTAQDIASYQVVLSEDGNIVGFQPTSRVAVNQWASNPLAVKLYKGRKLSPGLMEPNLRIPHPSKIILIELLMSVTPGSFFALARPFK